MWFFPFAQSRTLHRLENLHLNNKILKLALATKESIQYSVFRLQSHFKRVFIRPRVPLVEWWTIGATPLGATFLDKSLLGQLFILLISQTYPHMYTGHAPAGSLYTGVCKIMLLFSALFGRASYTPIGPVFLLISN